MARIRINDSALRKAVDNWLMLDGLTKADCTIADEDSVTGAVSDGITAPLVVVFHSEGYTRSAAHCSLADKFGECYVAVELPLCLSALSEAVNAVTSASGTSSERAEEKEEKTEAVFSDGLCTLRRGEAKVSLSPRESALFAYLYENKGRIVSRAELCEKVWLGSVTPDTNTVDVYISYLRRKTEPIFGKGAISSVRGEGYMLNIRNFL